MEPVKTSIKCVGFVEMVSNISLVAPVKRFLKYALIIKIVRREFVWINAQKIVSALITGRSALKENVQINARIWNVQSVSMENVFIRTK